MLIENRPIKRETLIQPKHFRKKSKKQLQNICRVCKTRQIIISFNILIFTLEFILFLRDLAKHFFNNFGSQFPRFPD